MYFVLYLNTALGILIRLSSLFPTAMMCVFIFCVYLPFCLLPPMFFFLIYINPSFPRPSASRPSCPSHLSPPPFQSILSSLIQLEKEGRRRRRTRRERSAPHVGLPACRERTSVVFLSWEQEKEKKIPLAQSYPGSISGRKLKPAGHKECDHAKETVTKCHWPHALTGGFPWWISFFPSHVWDEDSPRETAGAMLEVQQQRKQTTKQNKKKAVMTFSLVTLSTESKGGISPRSTVADTQLRACELCGGQPLVGLRESERQSRPFRSTQLSVVVILFYIFFLLLETGILLLLLLHLKETARWGSCVRCNGLKSGKDKEGSRRQKRALSQRMIEGASCESESLRAWMCVQNKFSPQRFFGPKESIKHSRLRH